MPVTALSLPPLLNERRLDPANVGPAGPEGGRGGGRERNRAFNRAVVRAGRGRWGAGDLAWLDTDTRLEMALVMEPEVPRERCGEMVPLLAVAFGDAFGAVAPPEVAVTYRWPDRLLVNGAEAGRLDIRAAEGGSGPPDWLVVGLSLAVRPDARDADPGHDPSRTTLWDEGCGEITVRELAAATARHATANLHLWDTEGFAPIHRAWTPRHAGEDGFVGLDERGNALVRRDGRTVLRDLLAEMEGVAA